MGCKWGVLFYGEEVNDTHRAIQFIRGLSLFLGGVLVKLNNQDYKMQMKFH